VAASVFVLLWSTGFIGAKFGLPYAEPLTFLAIRFAIVGALLSIWALLRGEFQEGGLDIGRAALIGVLIHGCYLGGVFTAISLGVGAALSALIVGLQPIVTMIIARPLLGERLTRGQMCGLAFGFAGVALVVWRKLEIGEISLIGLLLCVGGLLAISYASVLQKQWGARRRLAANSAIQFWAAAAVMAALAFVFETREVNWTLEFTLTMLWLICALSLGAIGLLYYLIRKGDASSTASLFFLVPGVTAFMAWALFDEAFGVTELIGLGLASFGVALTTQVFASKART
jgi:drug/metabolite transporter (DMT)-like permease